MREQFRGDPQNHLIKKLNFYNIPLSESTTSDEIFRCMGYLGFTK